MMGIYVIQVHSGDQAGVWRLHPVTGKWKRVPGWEPQLAVEAGRMLTILSEARLLKTPGLTEEISRVLAGHVEKEVGSFIKEGDILIVR
jgi:hypothetical protein